MKHVSSFSVRFVLFATGVTAIGGFLLGYDTVRVMIPETKGRSLEQIEKSWGQKSLRVESDEVPA